MKYSQWIGILAAILLVGACFLPWAWYPDLNKEFTGFFSERNLYGKPGKVMIFFCILAIGLFATPRIWAKRTNMMVCALTIAYGVSSYITFTKCYRGICPEKRIGIFLVIVLPLIMLIASALPDLELKKNINEDK